MNRVRSELEVIMENAALEKMEQDRTRASAEARLRRMRRKKCLSKILSKIGLN